VAADQAMLQPQLTINLRIGQIKAWKAGARQVDGTTVYSMKAQFRVETAMPQEHGVGYIGER
jgi:hypothetical protein